MTNQTSGQTFRGVVEQVDRHVIRVADEFQQFITAVANPTLKLRVGDVVEISREDNHYRIGKQLSYHLVERVRHPDVPTLWGQPVADIGDPELFSVRGQVYARDVASARPKVENWVFDSPASEAAYLNSVLLGAAELPGIQISEATIEKLGRLGVDT